MKAGVKRFLVAEQGVTSIEYSLIALLIALALILGVTAVGTNVAAMYRDVAGKFPAIPRTNTHS